MILQRIKKYFVRQIALLGREFLHEYDIRRWRNRLGAIADTAVFEIPDVCTCPKKIFLGDYAEVYEHSKFIISPVGEKGNFIMKRYSGAAEGLTIITGNHQRTIGKFISSLGHQGDVDQDVVIEEDVWIGANVTITAGVTIGRGATIAAGSVCNTSVPPYAVVMGNPARVVRFAYAPLEIIEHEKQLYLEKERLPLSVLENNYTKYYSSRLKEIIEFLS